MMQIPFCVYVHLGTKVVEVRATDADDPTTANGELRYSLSQDLSAFEIDSITGGLAALTSNIIVILQLQCLFLL